MADLRKAARGRECQVRIPGVCNGNPETSVLAHIRLTGLCGTGTKPPDLIATIACSACHDEIVRIPLYSITDWHRSPISDSHPFDQPGT